MSRCLHHRDIEQKYGLQKEYADDAELACKSIVCWPLMIIQNAYEVGHHENE